MSKTIITMPLEKNVPKPSNPDWRLTTCKNCGRRCWETALAREAMEAFPDWLAFCTECALAYNTQEVSRR